MYFVVLRFFIISGTFIWIRVMNLLSVLQMWYSPTQFSCHFLSDPPAELPSLVPSFLQRCLVVEHPMYLAILLYRRLKLTSGLANQVTEKSEQPYVYSTKYILLVPSTFNKYLPGICFVQAVEWALCHIWSFINKSVYINVNTNVVLTI